MTQALLWASAGTGFTFFMTALGASLVFFFRGGDEFNESERLKNELSTAQFDLKRAKRELEDAQREYDKVKAILDDREGHAVALAESLGGTSFVTSEHAQLRRKIAKLTVDIEDISRSIDEARTHASIGTVSAMDRERATYFLNIENLHVKIKKTQSSRQKQQVKLFRIIASDEWREASIKRCENQIQMRINEQLRKHVKHAFEQQNYGDNIQNTQIHKFVDNNSISSPEIQQLLQQRFLLNMQCQELTFQRTFSQIKRRVSIAAILDDLEKVGQILEAVGEEGINIEDLRKKYLPDGPLTPIKRASSGTTSQNRSKASSRAVSPRNAKGRSKSDIKRPFRSNRTILSPM